MKNRIFIIGATFFIIGTSALAIDVYNLVEGLWAWTNWLFPAHIYLSVIGALKVQQTIKP